MPLGDLSVLPSFAPVVLFWRCQPDYLTQRGFLIKKDILASGKITKKKMMSRKMMKKILYGNFEKKKKKKKKMVSRKIFRYSPPREFSHVSGATIMFILLISNHTVFLVQLGTSDLHS